MRRSFRGAIYLRSMKKWFYGIDNQGDDNAESISEAAQKQFIDKIGKRFCTFVQRVQNVELEYILKGDVFEFAFQKN